MCETYIYELENIKGNTYTTRINGTDIGIYRFGKKSAVLIDSGYDVQDDFTDFLESEGIEPVAVINTHLHIDHIGGNELLRETYHCDIYASQIEIIHENDAGYSGGENVLANPEEGILDICGQEFLIISLPGHSIGHQGVVTPDGVCFLGDGILSEKNLELAKMPYHYNIERAIESMSKIREMDYPLYVLSHNGVLTQEETIKTVKDNLKKEDYLRERIVCLCNSKISNGKLISLFMNDIDVTEEKRRFSWVVETAEARVKAYRR